MIENTPSVAPEMPPRETESPIIPSEGQPKENQATDERLQPKHVTMKEVIDFVRDVAIILAIVLGIRGYLISPFQISGSSMESSYHDKEFILVNKFSYAMLGNLRMSEPQRGDVAIIKPHAANHKEYYIKRVIGIPGDTVRFKDGDIYIKTGSGSDFVKLNEDYLSEENKGHTFLPLDINDTDFVVPADEYFLLGDNRGASADSRSCFFACSIPGSSHFIKRSDMSGKVLISFGYFNLIKDDSFASLGDLSWRVKPRWLDTPKNWIYPELAGK